VVVTGSVDFFRSIVSATTTDQLRSARRVCIARTMPRQDVCLSVRLSHAGIESKQLYISSKFFHHRVAPPYQMGWQCSDRDPPNGESNASGYEKITIFDQYPALSQN